VYSLSKHSTVLHIEDKFSNSESEGVQNGDKAIQKTHDLYRVIKKSLCT